MPIYLGTKKLDGLYLGAGELSKVYLGTTLVYQKGGGPTPPSAGVLFDHGWVPGINWAGNLLPRPPYTSIASYNFARVDTDGCMVLLVMSNPQYSSVNHNCHVCTDGPITVPAGATKMCVNVTPSSTPGFPLDYSPIYLKFGLVTMDCVNAMDAANGGQLSDIIELTASGTYELILNNGIAGNSYVPVVNGRANAKMVKSTSMSIYKVWFE